MDNRMLRDKKDAHIVVLRDKFKLTYKQISLRMGVSAAYARIAYYRGKKGQDA